ncbi:MAG: hypothetical protein U0234_07935 [Sandaracinus sp.]
MGARIEQLPREMRDLGVDAEIALRCEPWIARVSVGLKAVA